MLITKFVEVPNTNIQEEVTNDFGYDLCYDMAQQFGHAQLVWYALNGTRVVEGEYTDRDEPLSVRTWTAVRAVSRPPYIKFARYH